VIESTPKRVVKLAISAVVHAADLVVGAVVPSRRLARRFPGIALLYHGVAPAERRRFGRHLDQLGRLGALVSIDDLLVAPDGRWRIAVTFDDGLVSYAEQALPEMASRSVASTVFVPSAAVGAVPAWAGADSGEAIMTAVEVGALPAPLVAVGSHSRTHARLPALGPGALAEEVAGSRSELEGMIGREVRALAFPFGDWSERVLAASREAGYERVFTVSPEPVRDPEGFAVGRVTLDPGDWPAEVRLKALGAYRWIGWLMELKRRR
jgi:peptidoglycan/xylan/chitin deacetylase (PgdA/CDA1 family)